MALSPRSLLKSPIFLLALLISGGIAAAGLSLLSFATQTTVEKSSASVTFDEPNVVALDACQQTMPGTREFSWAERDFVKLSYCYDDRGDASKALQAASTGLNYHRNSETLYNIKAYQQIQLRDYEGAVTTLRTAKSRVAPTNSILENNLAWAGLWAPRLMDLGEARMLYKSALRKDAKSCETIHTGLWVEYSAATRESGSTRNLAIKEYNRLRERYNGCEKRALSGDRDIVHEVLGAGVLDLEMARLAPKDAVQPTWARKHTGLHLMRTAMKAAGSQDVQQMCELSTPVTDAHHTCVKTVRKLRTCKSKTR